MLIYMCVCISICCLSLFLSVPIYICRERHREIQYIPKYNKKPLHQEGTCAHKTVVSTGVIVSEFVCVCRKM